MEINKENLISFILKRQNKDGGFGFTPPHAGWEFPTGLPDTYYCASSLASMHYEIPNQQQLSNYLDVLLSEQTTTPQLDYYINSIGELIGKRIKFSERNIDSWIQIIDMAVRKKQLKNAIETIEGYSGASSPLQNLFYSLCLLKKNNKFDLNCLENFEMPRMNDIISVAYSVLIKKITNVKDTYEFEYNFVDKCLIKLDGSFTYAPDSFPAYLESTYYGCLALHYLKYSLPLNSKKYVATLQNVDGGFRRSNYNGISTPENCFYATSIITNFELMDKLIF